MNFPFYIAKRYLFSKKSSNAINIITLVSMVGIMVGTAALILVLSVFNGLSSLLEGLFAAVDPDIKILAAEGKSFADEEDLFNKIAGLPDVAVLTRTIEGRAILQYADKQAIAVIKGVEPNFTLANPIDSATYLYDGEYTFEKKNGLPQAVLGAGVAERLSANLNDHLKPIQVQVLNENAGSIAKLPTAILTDALFPGGFFSVQKEYNDKYVLVSLGYARDLFRYEGKISGYEIALRDPDRVDKVKEQIEAITGEAFEVLTWYEQHETLYRVMRNEKYIGYLILTLLLVIAAVNIVGSLSMIVLEKTRDISVLKSMGATSNTIRKVFLMEGILVGGIGVVVGMAIAFVFGLLQQHFGLLTLQNGENFRINAFPIEMQLSDFVLIFCTVIGLSILASIYPSHKAANIEVVQGLRQ